MHLENRGSWEIAACKQLPFFQNRYSTAFRCARCSFSFEVFHYYPLPTPITEKLDWNLKVVIYAFA